MSKIQNMSKITMTWPLCNPFHQFWNIITVIKIKYFQHGFQHANINIFNTPWNFNIVFNMRYRFQHTLKFSTCCFNIVFNTYCSIQHALKFSTCFSIHLEIFNIVLNLHYSFQHELQFSEHAEIFNMLFCSFQNMLKISTCSFTVFRTCWKFQHAFLRFSTLFFNMFSKCVTDFNTLWNFQHTFKHENLKHLQSNCNWTLPEIFVKS